MNTKLEILEFPDKRLRETSIAVETFNDELKQLAEDMLITMYQSMGIGLAAPQVNHRIRLIVIDISEKRNEPMVFVNPEIKNSSGEIESSEGCLSVPDIRTEVNRFESIEIKANKLDGEVFYMKADGLLSICVQHEIDHLDGKLFIDYVSEIKLERLRKKIIKDKKALNLEKQTKPDYLI
ncbi:peptide deformylase [Gammaproteobacteria bacterium]|nr:peptide deformylase [Gammaproteobacteria bacterium]